MNTKMTAQEFFEFEKNKRLSEKQFPSELISEDFMKYLHRALLFENLRNLQCLGLTYHNFIFFERPFMMPEVEIAIEIIKASNPIDIQLKNRLDLSKDDISSILKEQFRILKEVVEPVILSWEEEAAKITEPLKREIEVKEKLSLRVPIGKRIFKENTPKNIILPPSK